MKCVIDQHLPVQFGTEYDVKNRVLNHWGKWNILYVKRRVSRDCNGLQGLKNIFVLINISEETNFNMALYSVDTGA